MTAPAITPHSTGITPPFQAPSATTNGQIALRLAEQGFAVIPNCWPDANGACAVPNHQHKGEDTGKAPIMKGWQSRVLTRQEVADYWRRHPLANVGLNLEKSGLLLVDPDTDEAFAEANANGIAGGIIRQSRNPSYLFRRPADCPIGVAIHQGASVRLDVMTHGQVIVHGKHREGQDVYLDVLDVSDLELVESPGWPVEILKQAEARRLKEVPVDDLDAGDVDDEPPVRLDARALLIWRGQIVVSKADHQIHRRANVVDIDRSETLFRIGRDLAEAGATQRTIVDALAERDHVLGFERYSGRPDGGRTEYVRIAVKVLDHPRENPPPTFHDERSVPTPTRDTSPCVGLVAEVDQLKARVAELEGEVSLLKAERSAIFATLRNKALKVERVTALATVFACESAASRRLLKDGWARVPLGAIGENAGVSEARVSAHLTRLEKLGILQRKVERQTIPDRLNPSTGELKTAIESETRIRLCGSVTETLERLAAVQPEPTDETTRTWGGKRKPLAEIPHCPDHPDAPLIAEYSCGECHRLLDRESITLPSIDEGLNGQDDGSVDVCTTMGVQDDGSVSATIILPNCPVCRKPAERLGTIVDDRGHGRFGCPYWPDHAPFWSELRAVIPDRSRFRRPPWIDRGRTPLEHPDSAAGLTPLAATSPATVATGDTVEDTSDPRLAFGITKGSEPSEPK